MPGSGRIVVGKLPRDENGKPLHPHFVRLALALNIEEARERMSKPEDGAGGVVPEHVVPEHVVPGRVVTRPEPTPPAFRLTLVPKEAPDIATALREALEAGDLVPVTVEACPHNRPACRECGECPDCGCSVRHAPEVS